MDTELQKKLDKLRAHYEQEENKKYGRLVVDKSGAIIQDASGMPLVEHYTTGLVKDSNDQEATITHLISTPRIDYVRDVMNPFGCDDQPLRKNRGVFFNHSWDGPRDLPIGNNLWLKKTRDGVLVMTKYAVGLTRDDFAGDVYRLAKAGFLNSYSIGFFLKAWDWLTLGDLLKLIDGQFDIPNIDEYSLDDQIVYHSKWMCYEYSQVGVPMNQDAVAKSLRKALDEGIIHSDLSKTYFGKLAEQSQLVIPPVKELPPQEPPKEVTDGNTMEEGKGLQLSPTVMAAIEDIKKQLEAFEQRMTAIDEKANQALTLADHDPIPTEEKLTVIKIKPTTTTVETAGKSFDATSIFDRAASGAVNRSMGKLA